MTVIVCVPGQLHIPFVCNEGCEPEPLGQVAIGGQSRCAMDHVDGEVLNR